jgi:hypothetical protein
LPWGLLLGFRGMGEPLHNYDAVMNSIRSVNPPPLDPPPSQSPHSMSGPSGPSLYDGADGWRVCVCRVMTSMKGFKLSHKQITVSTVGVVPRIRQLTKASHVCHESWTRHDMTRGIGLSNVAYA